MHPHDSTLTSDWPGPRASVTLRREWTRARDRVRELERAQRDVTADLEEARRTFARLDGLARAGETA